ncbi:hypothetical protein PsorP6_011764 [Peronosclerospora sorghi]|uniref:Uncharacterized protein n=1 Tax=Peronosclerospora sorghi TaxID=230839 RepID=A0ACC0WL33_9STRA|nr:hypothetical protein PsorP6_011764 [Peronosclerospora sorghi]
MGLSRRTKAAESDLATSTTSKFLALFHKKHDAQDPKRPQRHRAVPRRSTHRVPKPRTTVQDEHENITSPTSVKLTHSSTICPTTQDPVVHVARDACDGVFPHRSARSSSSLHASSTSSSSRGSSSSRRTLTVHMAAGNNPASSAADASHACRTDRARSSRRDGVSCPQHAVHAFLAWFPRTLTPDVRVTCSVSRPRASKRYVRGLLVSLEFEIRATKWAAYFLALVHNARLHHRLSVRAALSIQWVICAYIQGHAHARVAHQKRLELALQRKMTEYRVALQCVAGTPVVKFGRKGKPHATTLCVENGDTLRWTSKLLAHATHLAADGVAATTTMGKKRVKAKNAIPLASIVRVTSGPSTSVLARALHKHTLVVAEAGCTLSVVTPTRTLDLKAKTTGEREWLQRSLEFLVDLARDHARRVAQQVELTIMKRMETLSVWKYGRKGRPHKTRVFVDRFGEVSWLGRSGDSLQLDEIQLVQEGHATPVFQRARGAGLVSSANAPKCFSLVTASRSLDIEARNEHERDWFVVAFRYLLDKVHEKTAALQRERAEKQLRMLHEFCCRDEHERLVRGDGDDDLYYDDCPRARH